MSVSETVNARESSLRGSESYRSSQLESLRRRMASSSLGDEDGAGLGDPFAEIFARIATAEAPSAPAEVTAPESPVNEDSEVANETTDVEESDSQDESEPSAEIAPVKIPEALLNTDNELVEVVEEEDVEIGVVVDEQLGQPAGDAEQYAEEADIEVVDVQPTTIQESSDTPVQAAEVSPDAVVDQEVVAVAIQSNRRDRGESETEAVAQTESEETEVRTTTVAAKTDVDSSDEHQQGSERSAPVAAEAKESVQRRRYSSGQDNADSQDDSSSSADPAVETQSMNGRGQESRSSQAASSRGSIDVSSLTPVSSSASAGVPVSAATSTLSSNTATAAATAAATKASGVGASSTTSSVMASSTGGDATAPVESPSNNQRSSPTGTAKSNATGTDTLSAVQRAKLVQRVSRGFQQLGSNGGQIRMRLAPDQLGSVQLQMKLQNGELSGTMVTQTEAASQALREQLPQLRSSLESQGIRLDRMEIQTEAAANAQDASTPDGRFGDTSGQSGRGFDQRGQLADQRERSSWSDVRATPKGRPGATPESAGRSVSFAPEGAVDLRA